ncbi:MAG: hypothetical protein E2O29_02100 [Deltaproteobacteria bacterium]|nr:MAG: hypothetical protein E2O29_02100 [Deltaproteobacteria bacterium]
MKRIKCTSGISAIKINGKIINFAAHNNDGKNIVLVSENIAKELLKRDGFILVHNKNLKTNWIKNLMKLIGGNKYGD